MKNKSFFGIILLVLISFIFLNCSSPGTSNVTIHINLGLNKASAANTFENSIIDKIFRLFTKDVEAQTAPSHVTSIELNVTGSGMDSIHQTYTSPDIPDSIDLEIPSGPSRLFEVLAYTPSATLRGAVTESLVGGTTVTIPIRMSTYETKIIIPDYQNYRIVQINDMTGTGWSVRSTISGINQFRPYDVAFDRQGRIYITNNVGGSAMGDNGVIRLNHFTDTSPYLYPDSTRRNGLLYDYGIVAVTIDINNNYIYYARSAALYREDLNDTTPTHDSFTTLSTTAIGTFRGITCDDQGLLYLAGTTSLGSPAIFIYNPSTQTVITSVTNLDIPLLTAAPWHLLLKGSYLYVANPMTSGTNNQILLLNKDTLQFIQGYGNYSLAITTQGYFYGPRHFVAVLNRKIYIIDEGPDMSETSKLISMDDINGTNWEVYGAYGLVVDGVGHFNFYFYC